MKRMDRKTESEISAHDSAIIASCALCGFWFARSYPDIDLVHYTIGIVIAVIVRLVYGFYLFENPQ